MIEGTFEERPEDLHVVARQQLFGARRILPEPNVKVLAIDAGAPRRQTIAHIHELLTRTGIALVDFQSPPDRDHFREIGESLGTLMPETAPDVQPFVEYGTILNLIAKHGHATSAALQPFSTDYLSLHSEGSGRDLASQPRYIVLLCLEPGDDTTRAQTVIVPMADVEAQLSKTCLELLRSTRYRRCVSGPMIARASPTGTAFSFRDFESSTLDWVSHAPTSPADVDGALRALLAAMYWEASMSGIVWRRGLMVLLDNFRFFHGRTGGEDVRSTRPRHLIRLRVAGQKI